MKNNNVVIASHIFATGPALELEQYLYPKVKTLLFIGHPFSYTKDIRSFKRMYLNGQLIKTYKAFAWRLPEGLLYIKDALYTLLWVIFQKGKIDLFIGSDNFLGFIGLILKRVGKVNDVILYTIDYVPKRFQNPLLNRLYHFCDKQCLMNCKVVWNVSEEISKAREKFDGLNKSKCVPQIVVPLGIWYDRIAKLSSKKKDTNTIVFMGHLLEKQGLDVVINSIPLIAQKTPEIKFLIIGTGPYEKQLKKITDKLNINKKVKFLGYIKDHIDVEKILSQSTIAVAIYKPDPESFTYFADPGKIKNYLACGLPVFLTDVPSIAKVLEKNKCGIICSYDKVDVAEKIIDLMKNKEKLNMYSKNARKFAKNYDWNDIFDKALEKSLIDEI